MTGTDFFSRRDFLRRETKREYSELPLLQHGTPGFAQATQKALEDLWLDDAYDAESSGNSQKYLYIMGWVSRIPRLLNGEFTIPDLNPAEIKRRIAKQH
jgi:hypothetical protein